MQKYGFTFKPKQLMKDKNNPKIFSFLLLITLFKILKSSLNVCLSVYADYTSTGDCVCEAGRKMVLAGITWFS